MKAIQDVLRRIDAIQQRNRVLGFVYGVVKKFGDDQAGYLAALIAYYAFFSLFPLLLVMTTILGFVLRHHKALRMSIEKTVSSRIPVIDATQVSNLKGSGLALAIGLVLTLLAGIAVVQAFQHAMDEVWGVPIRSRPNFFVSRLRAIIMLGVLGAATLLATAVSSLGELGGILHTVGLLGSVILNIAIVAVAFKVLTAADVSWRDVMPGAVLAGVALTILQAAGTALVAHQLKHANRTYGTFALVIGLLSWLYLGAQITIYAAEVNVVKARRLWPRSLVDTPTAGDQKAFEARARIEERRAGETIQVIFDKPSTAG
jgi:YihY family inner membrane protein